MSNPFESSGDDDLDFQPRLSTNTGYIPPGQESSSESDGVLNPFGEPTKTPIPTPKPQTAPISSGKSNASDLDEMEYRLRMREEELRRREHALEKRIIETGYDEERIPNWPPFKPITYHSIKNDIPNEVKGTIKLAYTFYLLSVLAITWNLIAMLFKLGLDDTASVGSDIASSLIYFVAVPYLLWKMVYKVLYNSVRKDKSYKFMFFFLMNLIWIAVLIMAFLGGDGSGFAGISSTTEAMKQNKTIGLILLIATILFGINIIGWIVVLYNARQIFKKRKYSLDQAAGEVKGVVREEVGKEVKKEVMSQL